MPAWTWIPLTLTAIGSALWLLDRRGGEATEKSGNGT